MSCVRNRSPSCSLAQSGGARLLAGRCTIPQSPPANSAGRSVLGRRGGWRATGPAAPRSTGSVRLRVRSARSRRRTVHRWSMPRGSRPAVLPSLLLQRSCPLCQCSAQYSRCGDRVSAPDSTHKMIFKGRMPWLIYTAGITGLVGEVMCGQYNKVWMYK